MSVAPSSREPRAKLIVRRPASGIGEQYRISLKLDGAPIGSLGPGETVTREIAPGEHRLRASNTLMRKTVGFAASAGEEIGFLIRNRPGPGTALFAAIGAGWLYVALERESPTAPAVDATNSQSERKRAMVEADGFEPP